MIPLVLPVVSWTWTNQDLNCLFMTSYFTQVVWFCGCAPCPMVSLVLLQSGFACVVDVSRVRWNQFTTDIVSTEEIDRSRFLWRSISEKS